MPRKVVLHQKDPQIREVTPIRGVSPTDSSTNISVNQARITAQGYISEIKRSQKYQEHDIPAQKALESLIQEWAAQPRQNGSPDDFHNFSVLLASGSFWELSCTVLDIGLKRYPFNTDLLGDYLIYGIACERLEECRKHFQALQSIPMSDWTWRGFAFSIIYLNRLKDVTAPSEERNALNKQITHLAKSYKKHLPFTEGGYREVAKLYSKSPEKELQLLNEALSNKALGSCPTCALQAAEILFSQKRYQEALDAIQRSMLDANSQKQGGINESYLFFLSGLCKIALLTSGAMEICEQTVLDIYSDFNTALVDLASDHREKILKKVQTLEQLTFIKVTDEYEKLMELIGA